MEHRPDTAVGSVALAAVLSGTVFFRDLGKMPADLHDADADHPIVLHFGARQAPHSTSAHGTRRTNMVWPWTSPRWLPLP
jgi:hypothetical protein